MAALKRFEDQSKIDEEQRRQSVFVVHGRNEELRKSMFDFLRSIGLKPIEWSQAIQMTGETAPFVGNILDQAFLHAQAVVVLLTGDDEARLRPEYHTDKMPDYEKNLTPQSRPNVLFEAGLALGRFPKQTVIVEVGDLRPFSDIAGRHTIRLNNSTKARQDVAQRLSVAGCKVDLSGTDWHQTGNFDSNIKVELGKSNNSISDSSPIVEQINDVKNIVDQKNYEEILSRDECVSSMLLLAKAENPMSISNIAAHLRVNQEKALFYISFLIKWKLAKNTSGLPLDNSYSKVRLSDRGFTYLIEKELL